MKFPRSIFTEDHDLTRQSAKDFCLKELAPYHAQWEKDKMVSRESWLKAGEMGFLGITFPEEYGGSGLDFLHSAVFLEEILKLGFTGPGYYLHSEIVAPYIIHFGTEEQKKKWLPPMASGEVITSIAMTEPGAGSDLQNIKTTAIDKGDHYLVNGSKIFITNGYMCDMSIVAVKTDPAAGAKGVSLLLIDAKSEGFTKGEPLNKVGMKAQDTSELFFVDVKVPKENLLGQEGMGFKYLMTELPQERLLVGLIAVASSEGVLEETIQYVKDRRAFGSRVADFQNTKFKLAELYTELQIAQVFLDRCLELHLKKELSAEMAAMVKYNLTDLQCKIMDECVQLHGGYGYMWDYKVARGFADARAQRIYAGSNEIMKEIISRKLIKD
jgi:alkylation response protein AidB-like acyl-CoA dehydrogenase